MALNHPGRIHVGAYCYVLITIASLKMVSVFRSEVFPATWHHMIIINIVHADPETYPLWRLRQAFFVPGE